MNRYINKYIAIVLNTCIPIYICSVDFIFPLSILHQNSIIIRYVNLRCNHIKHGTTVSNLRFMSVFVQIQYKVSGIEKFYRSVNSHQILGHMDSLISW